MNMGEPISPRHARGLKIHWPAEENGIPVPAAVKVGGYGGFGTSNLPALLGRPRCWQETRRTAEPAPRQLQLMSL